MRFRAIYAMVVVLALSAFGEARAQWRTASDVEEGARGSIVGTVTDLDAGRNQFTITPDDERSSLIVATDAVSTQYNGFGGVINGKPEIFTGSPGFANIRVGDRVDVRGIGAGNSLLRADYVTLLGRSTAAPQVGVGSTRPAGQISTPTAIPSTPAGSTTTSLGRTEGVVRQVSPADFRLVLETDRRQMLTVRGSSATPVYYRGSTYQMANIEVGDRIRVEPDTTSTAATDLRARSIEVVSSVSDNGNGGGTARSIASISGRVTRLDRSTDMIRLDTGRGEVRVDVATAVDPSGRRIRASDLAVNDRIEVSGTYGATSDFFIASTVRGGSGETGGPTTTTTAGGTTDVYADASSGLVSVTIYGTVAESLRTSPQIVIRESQTGRTVRLWALEDFPVRGKSGTYAAAESLREGDNVTVKAYRDADGNYVAQVIRVR